MINNKISKLKSKQIDRLIQTREYEELIEEVCYNITTNASISENEASIVSIFELELFSMIKDVFNLKYYPQKEYPINTERHISKGRIDSKIGALVLEFKHTSKLNSDTDKENASLQLISYLKGLREKFDTDYCGMITDGIKCKIITIEDGKINEGSFEKLAPKYIDRIIKTIVLLDRIALTPENLVKDFCSSNNSISQRLTLCLYYTLKKHPTGRSLMLFDEWRELFKLAHDDDSKQTAIIERRKSLENVIGERLKNNHDEYLSLYAIQTTYAIIVKVIAYKVISKIRFNKSLIDFNKLSDADDDTIRIQMYSLEEGAIFRSLGIGNLLEGDFFAWYCSSSQWTPEIGALIKEIFSTLTLYEDKALFQTGENVQDLFRDLFMKIMPDKVRHSLGEYYTPPWLADNLVKETLNLLENKTNWTALDPCAGSGTFVTILIRHVLLETIDLQKKERLNSVLSRVKAIDLNPLAVLTSRINYFINIAHLISHDDELEIPVFLGDSSYVPSIKIIDGIKCLSYRISTIKGEINIEIPQSACSNNILFSQTMTAIEQDILNLDIDSIEEKINALIPENDLTNEINLRVHALAQKFIDLEKNEWNGIWARIVTNFLTTANLGKFDIIAGNPPWIDWKNLPAGYRDRIKSICIDRHLFSGDSITGGINLNVCALISNVSASNWLKPNGVLAFLMPDTILFQKTYDGFRKFKINDSKNLYFQQLIDWSKSGHPFSPVTQNFMSFFFSQKSVNYTTGIPIKTYLKKRNIKLDKYSQVSDFKLIKDNFDVSNGIVGQIHTNSTTFTYAENEAELANFNKIAGDSYYKGREGIEFYPQELFILTVDNDIKVSKDLVVVKNFQNKKSKYKIPEESFPIEKHYLHPLIKGVDIERFHLNNTGYVVPFPYEHGMRSPISITELSKQSKLLAKYFNRFKDVLNAQTNYNTKIIGKKHHTEYYALARVGAYSYAEHYVAFRDNSKWGACVVSSIPTPWGEVKRPQFQNHAVSISQDKYGNFITLEEAHFICSILNARITEKYILNSSDSRSFKIDPPIFIPKYDENNETHRNLSGLSLIAHKHYSDRSKMVEIDKQIDELIIKLQSV